MLNRQYLFFFFSVTLFLTSICVYGQTKRDSLYQLGICDENGFCIPTLSGMPRPKGVEITRHGTLDYSLNTNIRDSASIGPAQIKQNRKWEVALRFPVLSTPRFKMAGGLRYTVEEFRFENPENLNNNFQRHLQNKPLRSLKSTWYVARPFKGNKYLLGRAGFSLNGDFVDRSLEAYFRGFAAALYGVKVNNSKTWGVGLSYSYTLGNRAVYPLVSYNKQFTPRMGVDMLLPVSIKLRYIPNQKNVFYFQNKLEGDNYNVDFEPLQSQPLFLGKADFLSFITYERELYDFLWITVSAGCRANINFDLSNKGEFINRKSPYIENTLGPAFFYRAGVFIVPPKKWMKNYK
jgi:hypothetical protein